MKNNKVTSDLVLFFLLLIVFISVEGFTTRGEFFYSSLKWIDHWLYLGHFEYGTLFDPNHSWNYKSSRLLWIWQGSLIFKYLSYPYNNYFIVIFSLTKFWFTFWLVIRKYLFNKRFALFYICIFMFYPTFRQNGGWYYHNFEACSWWLLAIYILGLVETKRLADKFIVLAGLFAGFSINTNLFFVNFLPIFILIAPRLFFSKKSLCLWAMVGALASILVLGLINLLLGGPFQYFIPMYHFIMQFKGASDLWKPFLYGDSFKLFILMSSVASYSLCAKIIEYRKTGIYHHRPFSIAYLYTAIVYLFWHLRGIEVLATDLHNSILLLMGFLMLVEVGESVAKKTTSTYMLIFIFLLSWISVHLFITPSKILFHFSLFSSSSLLVSLVTVSFLTILLGITLKLKNTLLWIGALTMIPYGMSSYRLYPQLGASRNKCFDEKRGHDIVFDIKREIQKISEPMVLSLQGESEIANTVNYIGNQKKWPLKRYFDMYCHLILNGTNIVSNSTDYPYLAVITNSKLVEEESLQCKNWLKYENTVISKVYKKCNGDSLFFSIFSAKRFGQAYPFI